MGFSVLQRVVLHSQTYRFRSGWVGMWGSRGEILSEAKIPFKMWFCSQISRWAMKHAGFNELPCDPSLPESLVYCLEPGTSCSYKPFLGAASWEREGFPFWWEVKLFSSLRYTQSQAPGIPGSCELELMLVGSLNPSQNTGNIFRFRNVSKMKCPLNFVFAKQFEMKKGKKKHLVPAWSETMF